MKDKFNRDINYLRISVTDLCNLRCKYCMPEEGVDKSLHQDIISVEETIRLAEAFRDLGVRKIRLTGGEPLVRKGIVDIVRGIASLEGIEDLAMTSNGILLKDYAKDLKEAGLKRVNISLDTLRADRFRDITRGGDIDQVFQSIEEARRVGLGPIKLNVVLMEGFNHDEVSDFIELTRKEEIDVRFIELMPIGEAIDLRKNYLSNENIIKSHPELRPVAKKDRSSPADYYGLEGALGRVGFINPISCKFCSDCNRIRLTSHGKLKLCLHSDEEYDLRPLLSKGKDLKSELEKIVLEKPEKHELEDRKFVKKKMHEIGG